MSLTASRFRSFCQDSVRHSFNAEELRLRLHLVAHSFVLCFLWYRRVSKASCLCNYADFLLRDFVFGLHARNAVGGTVSSPLPDLVIAYVGFGEELWRTVSAIGKPRRGLGLVRAFEKGIGNRVSLRPC